MIKEKLRDLSINSMTRIDDVHILDVYVGLTIEQKPLIIVKTKNDISMPKSTKVIKIEKDIQNGMIKYYFYLTENKYSDMFLEMFEDIIEYSRTSNESHSSLKLFVKRLLMWMYLFAAKKSTLLSENQITGLFGELLFLDTHMIKQYGGETAVKSWYGPYWGKKDFELNAHWYEVKMTKYGCNTISISSVSQLDDVNDGELIVYSYSFTGQSNNNLFTLVEKISNRIESIETVILFFEKLGAIGYEHRKEYKDLSFEVKSKHTITIDNSSKIIRRSKLSSIIEGVQYELRFKEMKGDIKNGPIRF